MATENTCHPFLESGLQWSGKKNVETADPLRTQGDLGGGPFGVLRFRAVLASLQHIKKAAALRARLLKR